MRQAEKLYGFVLGLLLRLRLVSSRSLVVAKDLRLGVDTVDTVVGRVAAGVGAGATAAIGNVEATVETRQSIGVDDDELNDIVENIETSLVVEPGWVSDWADLISDASTEGCAKSEKARGEDKEEDLGAHATLAKLVHGSLAREQNANSSDEQGQEGQDCKVGNSSKLYFAELRTDSHVESVKAVHNGNDDHDEVGENAEEQEAENERGGLAPADVRVKGAEDALREDEVDKE